MMVEALHQLQPELIAAYSREISNLGLLNVAFIAWLWRMLKQERSDHDGTPVSALEIDHIKPVYRGGTDDGRNLRAVTRPEHAEKHLRAAQTTRKRDDRKNEYRAVNVIVSRMTDAERKEFNKKINKHE